MLLDQFSTARATVWIAQPAAARSRRPTPHMYDMAVSPRDPHAHTFTGPMLLRGTPLRAAPTRSQAIVRRGHGDRSELALNRLEARRVYRAYTTSSSPATARLEQPEEAAAAGASGCSSTSARLDPSAELAHPHTRAAGYRAPLTRFLWGEHTGRRYSQSKGTDSLKQALVTGASRGIGAAVARALADDGFRVWIHYRSRDEAAREVGREIVKRGCPEPLFFRCDLADRRATDDATHTLLAQEGVPEALVLAAGITHGALFALTSDEDWDRLIATNLGGFLAVGRPVVKAMLRARSGRIVVLSSVVASVGNPGQVAYAATKGGLNAAALSLARELEPRGITVNVVAPGLVDTEMLRGAPVERLLRAVPVGRLGRPEEVAHVVRYLCSADGRPMTGRTIHVDGGMRFEAG